MVLDLAKESERVSLPVVWAWATHVNLLRKMLRVLCGHCEHQRRVQFEGSVAEPLQNHHGHHLWVEVERLALLRCVSICSEWSDEGGPAFES